jgi:hypothetical protein
MKTSTDTDEIAAALAKAQVKMENPTKDATNPHYRSRYATLDTGLTIAREALGAQAIAITQATRFEGEVLMLDTRLTHASGQWMESEFPIIAFPAKPQEVGSATTYARRYSLFALIGVAGEDDDGEAANAKGATPAPVNKTGALSEDGSAAAREMLLTAICMATTLPDLATFARENGAAKARLTLLDKGVVETAFKLRQNELKNFKPPVPKPTASPASLTMDE